MVEYTTREDDSRMISEMYASIGFGSVQSTNAYKYRLTDGTGRKRRTQAKVTHRKPVMNYSNKRRPIDSTIPESLRPKGIARLCGVL